MNGLEVRFRADLTSFALDVEFRAPSIGVTAIFGPSGAGKTTVLRCVAGLERPSSGRLVFLGETWQNSADGTFLPPHRRPVGYVFQEAALFPHLTVRGNLDYGSRRRGHAGRSRGAEHAVEWMGVGPLLERKPDRLSGGERQRVAVARALLARPRLLLMDEPLAGLDDAGKAEILPYLESLHRESEVPVLYVSHSRTELMRLADHVVLVDRGRVVADGPLPDFTTRSDLAGFGPPEEIGTIAEGRAADRDEAFDLTQFEIPGGVILVPGTDVPIGARRRLRFLARDISLTRNRPERTSILNVLPATVVEVREPDTALPLVALDTGGTALLSRISRKSLHTLELRPGTEVFAQIKGVALIP